MNPGRFLKHFDRIAEAPGAATRLRQFVLDLAARGKLVAQDACDESALELLQHNESRKAALLKDAAIKQQPTLPRVTPDEEPFSIPQSWAWVRFGEIADFSAGRTPPRHDSTLWNNGDHSWCSIADMKDGEILTATKETVSEEAKNRVFKSEPEPIGTMIMSFKLTIGKIAKLGIPSFHNEAIISIRPHIEELDPYLFLVLPHFSRQGNTKDAIKGATLNRKSIANILLPLPPLSEQKRIVKRFGELIALCDQLEEAQSDREAHRFRLVTASLHQIRNPNAMVSTEVGLRNTWTEKDFLRQFPRMMTRSEHIAQLRQAILSIAVCGRLLVQDPADEPATKLLNRIKLEKETLVEEGTVKPDKPVKSRASVEPSFHMPASWKAVYLQEICTSITDGDHMAPPKSESGIPFLVIGNVREKRIDFQNCRHVPNSYYEKLQAIRRPIIGDLLYTLVGSYGIPIVVRDSQPFCVQRHIGMLRPSKSLNVDFLAYVMESALVFDQATEFATGIAQKTVPLTGLRAIRVPLPPAAEQDRIVSRINELMALCDQLEAQVVSSQVNSRRFSEAVLREAI